jgi:hypothetical protein
VRPEELGKLIKLFISSGFEPATFRLVSKLLNHSATECAHCGVGGGGACGMWHDASVNIFVGGTTCERTSVPREQDNGKDIGSRQKNNRKDMPVI